MSFPLPKLGDRVLYATINVRLRGEVIKIPDASSPGFVVRWDDDGAETPLGEDWFLYGNIRIQTREVAN